MLPTSDDHNANSSTAAGTPAGQAAGVAAPGGELVRGSAGLGVAVRSNRARPIAPRPEILYSTPTAIDLIRALQRRWLLALIIGILFATCAIVYVFLTTTLSTSASAFVRVHQLKPKLLYPTTEKAFAGRFNVYVKQQQVLIDRKFVVDAILKEPGVRDLQEFEGLTDTREYAKELRAMFSFGLERGTEFMAVTVRSERPETCAFLANTIKRVYLREVVEAEKQARLTEYEKLEKRYEQGRQQWLKERARLKEMERNYGGDVAGPAVEAEKERAVQRLIDIRDKASETSLQVHRLNLQIELLKGREADESLPKKKKPGADRKPLRLPGEALEGIIRSDALLGQWKSDVSGLEQLIAAERLRARDPRAPSILELETRVRNLRSRIQERTAELQLQVWDQFQPEDKEPELSDLEKLERQRDVLQHDLKFYVSEYEKRVGEARRIKEYSDDLAVRRSDVKFQRNTVSQLRLELQRREFEFEARPRIEDNDDAEVPLPPSTDGRNKKMRLAGFGGFCLALIGVSLYEFMARRITSPIEMTEGLGVRVMGNIPLFKERSWRHRMGIRHESARTLEYLASESMDSIRETMLHGENEGMSVVMVASAVRGEGKSTVASQLATSVARSGRRTLLVDGDMRSPSAHIMLDLPEDQGLAEALSGQCTLADAIRPTEFESLWLLQAGIQTADGLRELAKGGFRDILATLREEFDFIVIDTPPALEVPDALAIGKYVDGAVVSVVYRVSQISRVYETIDRLQTAGIDVQGCVVNGRSSGRIGKYDYGYDYGYGYGGSYGNGRDKAPPADST